MSKRLLDPSEGSPVAIERRDGRSPVILVCEHASKTIPRALGDLGAKPETLSSHAAWDVGALAVARRLSGLLDAPLIFQRFSRLVYDCNRPPGAPGAIPEISEVHAIPGNRDLPSEDRRLRIKEIYEPFRDALSDFIESRHTLPAKPVIVTVHSYTRLYFGAERQAAVGLLHDRDHRLADAMLAKAQAHGVEGAARNYPYGPEDGVTHTLKLHALPRGLKNVMIEICNDLVADEAGQELWAGRLANLIADALGGDSKAAAPAAAKR